MKKIFAIVCLGFLLLAGTASAELYLGGNDPDEIRQELARLRVFYTDDHPDIQILLKHLEKAEKEKKERRLSKSGQSAPSMEDPAPPSGQYQYLVIPKKNLPPPQN